MIRLKSLSLVYLKEVLMSDLKMFKSMLNIMLHEKVVLIGRENRYNS